MYDIIVEVPINWDGIAKLSLSGFTSKILHFIIVLFSHVYHIFIMEVGKCMFIFCLALRDKSVKKNISWWLRKRMDYTTSVSLFSVASQSS